jgi:hypothetical protein
MTVIIPLLVNIGNIFSENNFTKLKLMKIGTLFVFYPSFKFWLSTYSEMLILLHFDYFCIAYRESAGKLHCALVKS